MLLTFQMDQSLTIVHTEASTGWGGQEKRIFSEMLALRERGHHPSVITAQDAALAKHCANAQFPTYEVSFKRSDYLRSFRRISQRFKELHPDVVNTHSSRDGYLAAAAARWTNVPALIRSRHIDVDYPQRSISRIAYYHLADHVLTTSNRIRNRLSKQLSIPIERISNIPTGIDVQTFDPSSADRDKFRNELKLQPHTKLVGQVSVLRSWKGHRILIQAISQLKDLEDLYWVFVGEGPMRQLLEEDIRSYGLEDRITLAGHREDIPDVLAALDYVVLASTGHEGVPQVVLQAQAMERLVIATEVGGIPEVVEHGVTGLLTEPNHPQALADALRVAFQDPEHAREIGKRARKSVGSNYSLSKMVDTLESLYSRLLT
ncbi:MAG: glycosyltransferase family 4 protein [Verrucomicrobiota bacterium]